ncbi:hypothetical protein DA2_2556 [Desulfovibrio sp. A2]|nr:hypothetical protein DA2_2556 [Desulfovibrio sp. A2]
MVNAHGGKPYPAGAPCPHGYGRAPTRVADMPGRKSASRHRLAAGMNARHPGDGRRPRKATHAWPDTAHLPGHAAHAA